MQKKMSWRHKSALVALKKWIVIFFSTGCFAGFSPYFPGTIGSLWGIPIFILLSNKAVPVSGTIVLITIACSVWLSTGAIHILKKDDPPEVVCDEIAGFLVATFLVPLSIQNIFFVFLLFRIFDIFKPFPIGVTDRKVKGGFGVVLDDLIAGVYSNLVFVLLRWGLHYASGNAS